MNANLKAIESLLQCPLNQIALEPIVNEYVESWKRCMERGDPLTDPDELIAVVEAEGIPVPTVAPLWSYLARCAEEYRVPNPRRIVTAIVHGYAEANFITGPCPCPLRQPLGPALLSRWK